MIDASGGLTADKTLPHRVQWSWKATRAFGLIFAGACGAARSHKAAAKLSLLATSRTVRMLRSYPRKLPPLSRAETLDTGRSERCSGASQQRPFGPSRDEGEKGWWRESA